MLTFTITIFCLTTSNLPWFMDLTFQVPMQYCSLQASDFASITSHIHSWMLFCNGSFSSFFQEKAMATHSSTLAGKFHGWRSYGVHGVANSRTRLSDFTFTFHFYALGKEMATHSSVLIWRISGTGEPGGLPSMGSHRVRQNWSDLAAAASLHGFPRWLSW